MDTSTSSLPKALFSFKETLKSVFGNRFSRMIVFGSYARGEARSHSDVDLLLVLHGRIPGQDDFEILVPLVARYLLETGVLFNVVLKSEEEYNSQNEGLMRNIEREGVLV